MKLFPFEYSLPEVDLEVLVLSFRRANSENEMEDVTWLLNVPKSTEKKRHYCCVCSNFSGKVIDGRSIRIHRFPSDQTVKRAWLRRLKLCYGQYVHSGNDRLCSEHFRDGEKRGENTVPCVFKNKTFNSSVVIIFFRIFFLNFYWQFLSKSFLFSEMYTYTCL